MFKTPITDTPLTTETANAFFQNIAGDSFQCDVSFLATLRALAAPRIKDDERIYLKFTNTNYSTRDIAGVSVDTVVSAIAVQSNVSVPGIFVVHSFNADQESNLANMRVIEEGFTANCDGYHRLDSMTDFFRKSFPVQCYINPALKSVVIFLERLDMKKLHYLQCAILAALPWYFNPDDGVSELEMELIYSLRERSSENYMACLEKIASQCDFRSARIRKLLSGFETRFEQIECEKVRSEITAIDDEIANMNSRIGDSLKNRNNYCIRLMGLEAKIAQGGEDSEIMEYVLCNGKIELIEVGGTHMRFIVKDYLSYFDKEMVERILNNDDSFVYYTSHGNVRSGIEPERMEKLLKAIFVEESLRIRFCAGYQLSLNSNVAPLRRWIYGYGYSTYMPNPHIDEYGCMGNYATTINQLLQNHDYIGAIEQCIASCKSLNWGDSTVMSLFMDSMYGSGNANNRCIELPDGSVVNPTEAIEWLEAQEPPQAPAAENNTETDTNDEEV